jgi:short-subunit dehydrogenase
LRGELAPHGIDVTKVNPGPYNTGFNDRMVDGITEYIDAGDASAHETNTVVREVVLTDQLDPADVAMTLADLAEAAETPPETLLPEGIGEMLQAIMAAEGY